MLLICNGLLGKHCNTGIPTSPPLKVREVGLEAKPSFHEFVDILVGDPVPELYEATLHNFSVFLVIDDAGADGRIFAFYPQMEETLMSNLGGFEEAHHLFFIKSSLKDAFEGILEFTLLSCYFWPCVAHGGAGGHFPVPPRPQFLCLAFSSTSLTHSCFWLQRCRRSSLGFRPTCLWVRPRVITLTVQPVFSTPALPVWMFLGQTIGRIPFWCRSTVWRRFGPDDFLVYRNGLEVVSLCWK